MKIMLDTPELDPLSSPVVADLLATFDPASDLQVDLCDVVFCDSSGVRTLLIAYRRHLAAGGSFSVMNPTPAVARVLEITGLAEALVRAPAARHLSLI